MFKISHWVPSGKYPEGPDKWKSNYSKVGTQAGLNIQNRLFFIHKNHVAYLASLPLQCWCAPGRNLCVKFMPPDSAWEAGSASVRFFSFSFSFFSWGGRDKLPTPIELFATPWLSVPFFLHYHHPKYEKWPNMERRQWKICVVCTFEMIVMIPIRMLCKTV